MIVYENNLKSFINQCNTNIIASKVAEEMLHTGIPFSPNEEHSWFESLPFVARALDDNSINHDINVAIEYQFQLNKSRVDFIVYGKDEYNNDSLVVIELKQWSRANISNKPNYVYAYGGGGQTKDYQHPSYQSIRYAYMLKSFNQYIQDKNVNINSCSYCHNMDNIYFDYIGNKEVYPFLEECPVYLQNDADKLRDFVKRHVKTSSRKILYEIDNSKIRPSKDFSSLLYKALKGQPIFTLDDGQAASVATIVYETNEALRQNKRKTIIIKGGPGTGVPITTQ